MMCCIFLINNISQTIFWCLIIQPEFRAGKYSFICTLVNIALIYRVIESGLSFESSRYISLRFLSMAARACQVVLVLRKRNNTAAPKNTIRMAVLVSLYNIKKLFLNLRTLVGWNKCNTNVGDRFWQLKKLWTN
jgi:hypothetical protein